MLTFFSKKSIFISSFIVMSVMFTLVMFYINPQVDGSNGLGVIQLQLAFSKAEGIDIISAWGGAGVSLFSQWLFVDYIYAAAYSVFFASLLSMLIIKKGKANSFKYTWVVGLAFIAGGFDWIENTIALLFINNPTEFSGTLFFIHSIVASLKWSAIPVALGYVVVLLMIKDDKLHH